MKTSSRWYSQNLQQDISVVRWGYSGSPVLLFPTAGGDAEEVERFQVIYRLSQLLDEGRIKVYSCDSIAGRAWTHGNSPDYCGWLQNRFDACVYREIIPAIRTDCNSADIEVITAGASIGAFNAVATLCRHPDVIKAALGLSGTYDLERFLHGTAPGDDFYFSSPLHYLPKLRANTKQLRRLRQRFVLMAFGQGRWDDPNESWRMAHVLGSKQIPNRVDPWGAEWDHDWPTWQKMLPLYLDELTSSSHTIGK